jgi:hypothetical protein
MTEIRGSEGDQEAFGLFTERIFATDRNLGPKGMLEVCP